MTKIKTRLHVLRAEREWSQAKLAAQVRVTRQTINSIEKGRYHPNLRLAFKIARAGESDRASLTSPTPLLVKRPRKWKTQKKSLTSTNVSPFLPLRENLGTVGPLYLVGNIQTRKSKKKS